MRGTLPTIGIASAVFYPIPLHLQPLYASLGGRIGDLPVAERAASEVLSLPLYPEMTAAQVDRVATAVLGSAGELTAVSIRMGSVK